MSTAGILIIGNEILSGKVEDANTPYLTRELRALGVEVRRIGVVPDEVPWIAREARALSDAFDHVFTSGGVGPTHDDVTIAGIAAAFGCRVVPHPLLEKGLRDYFGDRVKSSHLKMAEVPEGAELIAGGHAGFPLVVFRNLYILPGIPPILRQKFESVRERFRTGAIHLRRLYCTVHEEELAEHLNATLAVFPDLMLGSYPKIGETDHKVMLTLESRDAGYLARAAADLRGRLGGWVHREDGEPPPDRGATRAR